MADEERNFIESLSSPGDIHFLGRLSDLDTFALVQQATAYISTARCEGFGLGLAEAMALGCLPIAARNTSQIEVVDGIGILFSTLEELISALHSAAVAGYVRGDIQKQALERFLWSRSATHVKSLLEKLACHMLNQA